MRIESTIYFPYGIPTKKEVLGCEFPVVIDGIFGTIAFPNLPVDYIERIDSFEEKDKVFNPYLNPPTNSDIGQNFNNENEWGNFYDNNGNAFIKKCSIWFNSTKHNFRDNARIVSKNTPNFVNKFILFLEIMTHDAFDENTSETLKTINYHQFWSRVEKNKIIEATDTSINLIFNHKTDFISKETIDKAIKYSNFNIPDNSYILVRDAIWHKKKNDFRRAIIDSCSAIEIALTKKAIEEFKTKKIIEKKIIDSLLKKYHSLRGRVELMEILSIQLPRNKNDYMTFLSNVRNKAVHIGYSPDILEVNKAIQIATDTLKVFCNYYE